MTRSESGAFRGTSACSAEVTRSTGSPQHIPSAVARQERARYRIDYGVIEIGEREVAIAAAVPGSVLVHADGHGTGGLLGLGHIEDRIATDFDLARLESRRWDNARSDG